MVGDEEQYAAAMALMARRLGYPARVVMGFAPEVREDATSPSRCVGDDVTAWVEVPFEGVGWVSFRPTPDQIDVPQEQTPKPKSEPQPQVRQPPRAEHDEDELLTTVEIDDTDDDDSDRAVRAARLGLGRGGGRRHPRGARAPADARRRAREGGRRRRRASQRRERPPRGGAWEELVDRYAELGFEPPATGTRLQSARALERQVDEQGLAGPAAPVARRSHPPPRRRAAVDPRGDHRPRRVRRRRS